MSERVRFKEIVDRATLGYLTECAVCGKILTQPLPSYFEGMTYKERLENGDEMLRHFLETAGFDLKKELHIGFWTFLAYEPLGHSSYKALKTIKLWASKEDQDWMDAYGERQRERFKHIFGEEK